MEPFVILCATWITSWVIALLIAITYRKKVLAPYTKNPCNKNWVSYLTITTVYILMVAVVLIGGPIPLVVFCFMHGISTLIDG